MTDDLRPTISNLMSVHPHRAWMHVAFMGVVARQGTSHLSTLTKCLMGLGNCAVCAQIAAAESRDDNTAPHASHQTAAARHAAAWDKSDGFGEARRPMSRLEREQAAWKAAANKTQG